MENPVIWTLAEVLKSDEVKAKRLYGNGTRQKIYYRAVEYADQRAKGYTYKEIAKDFGVSHSTVSQSLQSLRRRVREVLAEEPTFFDDEWAGDSMKRLAEITPGEKRYHDSVEKYLKLS